MNKWREFGRWICATACVAIFAAVAFSQTDNTQLSGFVKDPSGAVVANAKVVVKNVTREFERTTTTNSDGYYIVTQLPPGTYTVTVEAQGFKTYKESDKKLDANIPGTTDVSLQTGQVSETVNVTASANQIQTESAALGKVVDAEQIKYIQLNGRNPLFLALLKPGVNGGALGGFSFSLTTAGLNINGSRTQDNLITFDGAVAVRTRSNGTSIGVADADSTQEVQILTANYNAEYGRSAGGQIRIVTKSGSRDFHGTAAEFMRNAFFNANSHSRNRTVLGDCGVNPKLDNCRPSPFRYNQYNYNINGPVYIPGLSFNKDRNKLFFLWGQEWVKQRQTSTTLTAVPTVKMRNGDFSELLGANPFYSTPKIITDPLTGLPYAGNIIPKAGSAGCGVTVTCTSPNGLALLNAYPIPTTGLQVGTANYTQSRPTTDDQRKDTVSIDFYPTEKHQFRWRAQLFHYVGVSAFRANTDRAPQIIDRPNQTTSLNWVWTISPNWVNEFLAAASRDQVFIYVDQSSGAYKRSIYGINYPYIFSDPKEIQDKIPTINFGSTFTDLDGGPYPSSSKGPIYQLSDNITNIRGAHTLKAGFLFERAGENDFDQINVSGVPGGTNNQNGRFEFRNGVGGTGLDIANAAIGKFSNYAEIGNRSYTPYRGHMYEWFIQDSWKVNAKLRIEAGLRHSIIQPFYSLWRNMSVFDASFYNPAIAAVVNPTTGYIAPGTSLASLYNGIVIPGDGFTDAAKGAGRVAAANSGTYNFLFRGVPKEYSTIHKKDFQPRVGIAYALNDKTVFRAGAGRFFTRVGVSDSVFLGGNAPFQPMVSIANGNVDNPGGGANNAFTQNITTQDKNFRNPETYTWNATFERELFKNTNIEIAYVGKRGLHAQRERNINQLAVGTTFLAANAGVKPDALRPYKGFNAIRVTENVSNSKYNALQLSVNRRFTSGVGFGLAYTLSKSYDSGSGQRDILPNAYDWSNVWAPSDFDRRHALVINFIYQPPIFKDKTKLSGKLLGGWTLNGVSQFQTGTPFSIATGDDFAGVGPGSGSQFWIINGNPQLDNGSKRFASSSADPNFWFATKNGDTSSIFVAPANGTISTQSARNMLYGPGFQNHNLGLLKDFSITERHSIQFRMDAFNWLNHPNWSGPDTNPRSATFGKILSKNSERNLQFALRYSF